MTQGQTTESRVSVDLLLEFILQPRRFHARDGIHAFRFAGPWVKRAFDDNAITLQVRAESMAKEAG
ncbi:MAG: hypothetical protein ACKO0U_01605 [Gammaproteobacteria bacterium]